MKLSLITLLVLFAELSFCQTVFYSSTDRNEKPASYYKILGNVGNSTFIHKGNKDGQRISVYNSSMQLVKNISLDYIDGFTLDIEFLVNTDQLSVFFIKTFNSYVTLQVARYNEFGNIQDSIEIIDTISSPLRDREPMLFKIKMSENKQMVLLHHLQKNDGDIYFSAYIYDKSFNLIRHINKAFLKTRRKRIILSDIEIDDKGNFFFLSDNGSRNDVKSTSIYSYSLQENRLVFLEIPMNKILTGKLHLTIDNAHNLIFISGLLYTKYHDAMNGILSIALDKTTLSEKARTHTGFSNDLYKRMTVKYGKEGFVYDHFDIDNIIVKSDSGIILILEENYTGDGRRKNVDPNSFGQLNNVPVFFGNESSISLFTPPIDQQKHSNDIILVSLDGHLNKMWETPIYKKQTTYPREKNFISYKTINDGSQIHFIFLENLENKQILSNYALQPNGEIKRYATIKSRQKGFEFMPTLGMQVGSNVLVVPGFSRNKLAFARINF